MLNPTKSYGMKNPKLLYYLDDDTDDIDFFKEAADALGQEVTTFMNGNELLYALRHEPKRPDIIFLDVHMPILNGEEILSILKKSEEYKGIPVVMISGAFPKKLVRDYLKNGADYLMKKPIGNGLKDALAHVLQIDFTTFFHAFN
jgi:CheY-like chemotaxis protein